MAKEGTVIVCTVSQLYLAFLNNWLISLAKQGQHHIVLIVADECATLWLREWGVARPCGFSTPSSRLHPKPTLLGLSWEQAGIWVSVYTFIHGNSFAIVYQDEVRICSCLKFAHVAIPAWLLMQPTRGPSSWALVGVIDFTAFSALQGLFNLTSCRPHLLAILQLGYAVLYNDVGLVWLADPFPLFEGHHDIFLSDDLAVVILGLTFACCSGQWLCTA